jgi:hypothetical protein
MTWLNTTNIERKERRRSKNERKVITEMETNNIIINNRNEETDIHYVTEI